MPDRRETKRVLIAFSGVDGSGKTTQARLLAAALEKRYGLSKVAYSHGNRPLFRSDVKGGDRARFRGRQRHWILSALILKKDVLKLWLFVWRHRQQQILVFDRYLDDAIAKFRFYSRPAPFLERLARWFAPHPTVVVWLDVPPGVSFERDREYPLEYHERKRAVYAEVFRGDTKVLQIDGTRPPDEIQARIQGHLRDQGWL